MFHHTIAVSAVGICGTDLHIYEWTPGYEVMAQAMPVTLGHEFSGTIAAIGPDVRGFAVGALVAVRPSVVCGHCANCRAGNPDACTCRKGMGVTRDGGLAKLARCARGKLRRGARWPGRTDRRARGADERERGSGRYR